MVDVKILADLHICVHVAREHDPIVNVDASFLTLVYQRYSTDESDQTIPPIQKYKLSLVLDKDHFIGKFTQYLAKNSLFLL